jgi:hypothetical protein
MSPKYQLRDARVDHGADTHRAGLKRDIQGRIGQSVIPFSAGSITQGRYLRMGSWILRGNDLVPALSQQFSVAHQYGTHRNLSLICCPVCECQRTPHPGFMVVLRRHQPGPFGKSPVTASNDAALLD